MKLISLEDRWKRRKTRKTLQDDMGLSPLYPTVNSRSGCNSCGKKGAVNINITNSPSANGNTASGNSNANNGFENTQSQSQPAAAPGTIQQRTANNPASAAITQTKEVVAQPQQQAQPDKTTITLLQKILDRINAPRPPASKIQTEKKPDNTVYIKEVQNRVPVDRPVAYIKEDVVVQNRDRVVPMVKKEVIEYPTDRVKTAVIEKKIPRFLDRLKTKYVVIRANQPPSPPSFA